MENKTINNIITNIDNLNINTKNIENINYTLETKEKAKKYIDENQIEIVDMFKESYINKYIKCFYPECKNKTLKVNATVPKFCDIHWKSDVSNFIETYIIKIRVSNDSSLLNIFGNYRQI